jgi:hypothetical protein
MNKLKINKTFIKGPRKKSKVKRIRKKIEILKQKRTNEYFFGEEREKQMVFSDEPFICLLHAPLIHTGRGCDINYNARHG